MRYLFFLLITLLSFGCSKDEFDPQNPKNGQIAELFVDHYEGSGKPMVFLLSSKEASPLYLAGFDERELGYTYTVKAKVIKPKEPAQDGPDRWFEFEKVISKQKYTGNEPFEISLVAHSLFGSGIGFGIYEGKFLYLNYELKPENDIVKKQLEDVLLLKSKFQTDQEYARKTSITAVVTHDPENTSKGYLVHEVEIK